MKQIIKIKLLFLLISLLFISHVQAFTMKVINKKKIKNLELVIYQHDYINNLNTKESRIYRFKIDSIGTTTISKKNVQDVLYFQIVQKVEGMYDKRIFREFIIEKSDDVEVILNDQIKFSGVGAEKMNYLFGLEKRFQGRVDSLLKSNFPTAIKQEDRKKHFNLLRYKNNINTTRFLLNEIERNNSFSKPVKELLSREAVSINIWLINGYSIFFSKKDRNDPNYSPLIKNEFEKLIALNKLIKSSKYASISNSYIKYLLAIDFFKSNHLNVNANFYKYALEKESKTLKEKLIITYLLKNYYGIKNIDSAINFAKMNIRNKYFLEELDYLSLEPRKGKVANDFKLFNSKDDVIRLSDFKGKVVFIDFWFPGCTACAIYYKESISKAEEYFEGNMDVVFVSIGIEKDKNKWLEAVNSNNYTNTKIVNLYTGPQGWRHDIIKNYRIQSAPKPMLIDREGKFISLDNTELGRTDFRRLIATIEQSLNK